MHDIDRITGDVIDLSIRIHRDLGPGLLESVYEVILAGKLAAMGYAVERQRAVDIEFEGMSFVGAFRIDLLVDDRLIVEIKSIERLNGAHAKQLLTYLRLTKQPVGLLGQLWRRNAQRGRAATCQQSSSLCASAPLRELKLLECGETRRCSI